MSAFRLRLVDLTIAWSTRPCKDDCTPPPGEDVIRGNVATSIIATTAIVMQANPAMKVRIMLAFAMCVCS
jgi:hypothetical protein